MRRACPRGKKVCHLLVLHLEADVVSASVDATEPYFIARRIMEEFVRFGVAAKIVS